MANTFSVTKTLSVYRAKQALDSTLDGLHYLFYGDHRPSTNTTAAPVFENVDDLYYTPWQQMIGGKQITTAALGVENIPYTFGFAYDRFDDQVELKNLSWYAIVNAGSYSHVFACLDNNSGANSTIQPDFTAASTAQNFTYKTSDGYMWMYLCSSSASLVANLATSNSFPIVANSTVQAAAVDGSIQVISVDYAGKRYDNYSSGTFQAEDIKVDAISTMYRLSNSTIRSVGGFYSGCVLLITGGTGTGQYATVRDFIVTANGSYANIDSVFPITPINGSTWELMPGVALTADSTQTVNVVARAVVNSMASNSISRVEVLNPGAGYRAGTTAKVIANTVVGVTTPAQIRPIMSPRGGHGFDPYVVLGATTLLVGANMSNKGAGDRIPTTNTYRSIGLMRAPTFANVQLTLSSANGFFTAGEPVSFLQPKFAAANATVNATSTVVTGDTRVFSNGDPILAIDVSGMAFLATVNTVTNSTSLTLTTNSSFNSTALATLYKPQIISNAFCLNAPAASNVFVSNVSATAQTGMMIYGTLSKATGSITTITRNDVVQAFDSFTQLYKYKITGLGGSFSQNEYVLQGNNQALVHSVSNGFLYVSNMTAPFSPTGGNLTGNTSGAIATVIGTYSPEVEFGSAMIDYVENLSETVTWSANSTASFIIPFAF